jgi:hypothetical protein
VLLHDVPQAGPIDVCVDLGRTDVGVAEEFLDNAKVGTSREQVGGETVSEHVRMHTFKPGPICESPDDLPDRHPLQRSPRVREQQPIAGAAVRESSQMASQFGAVPIKCLDRWPPDGNEPLLVALPGHKHDFKFSFPIAHAKCAHFAGAKTGSVHDLNQRAIAFPQPTRSGTGSVDEGSHLLRSEHARKPFPPSWRHERPCRAASDSLLGFEPAEEHPNRRQVPRDAARLESARAVEHLHMRRKIAGTDRPWIADTLATNIFNHVSQVGVVGGQRCF